MTSGLLNSPILLVAIGDYEPETSAWITRTEAVGGTIPTATKDAVDAFVVACKAAGIFTKFRRLNLFCGSNLTACMSPLVNTSGSTMDGSSGFSSGHYSEGSGLVGGSGRSISTGLIPNTTVNYNNWHLAFYVTNSAAVLGGDMGCGGHPSGNIQFRTIARYGNYGGTEIGSIVCAGDYNNGANQNFQTYGVAITGGLMLVSRTSSSSMRVRNTSGSVNAVNSLPYSGVQALPTNSFNVMTDGFNQYTGNTSGGYSVGLALNDTEGADFCSIMETFQTAMGRDRG